MAVRVAAGCYVSDIHVSREVERYLTVSMDYLWLGILHGKMTCSVYLNNITEVRPIA